MRKSNYSSWEIDLEKVTSLSSVEEKINFLINCAILAPSSHNTQPWKFRIKDGIIEVLPDFSRSLNVSDPTYRQMLLSIGCAVANIEYGCRYLGIDYDILFGGQEESFYCEVKLKDFGEVKKKFAPSIVAIKDRVTTRENFEQFSLDEKTVNSILAEVENAQNTCIVVRNDNIEKAVRITTEAISSIFPSKEFRSELAGWLRNNFTRKKDGMPLFDVPSVLSFVLPFLLKKIDVSKQESLKTLKYLKNAVAVFVVGSPNDSYSDFVNSGRVIEKIIVGAEKVGLSSRIMAAPIEDSRAREELSLLINSSLRPQAFVAVGKISKRVHHSPRRSVEEVILSK